MSYRIKLTIMIAVLIAVAFGIGGTLMITTSFNASLEAETQAALDHFESVQNTLFLLIQDFVLLRNPFASIQFH